MLKQRNNLLVFLAAALLFLAACGGGEAASDTANFVSHTDAELGLTLSYPESWIIHNSIGALTVASNQIVIDSESMADIGDNGFVLIIPGEIDVLNFQSDQDIAEDKPLPALYIYQQMLEKGGQAFQGLEPPHELELDDQTGAITLTRSTIDGESFVSILAVIMNDGQIALISAGALEENFDGLRPSLEQIIQSIQVTTPVELSQ